MEVIVAFGYLKLRKLQLYYSQDSIIQAFNFYNFYNF